MPGGRGPGLGRDVWWVLGADLMISTTVFGVQSAVMNLFLLRLGYDVSAVGRLHAISVVMYAACAVAVGAGGLPFRMRPRTAMMLGAVLGQASNLLVPLALFIPPPARTPFVLCTLLARSLGLGLYTIALQPYLMAASTPSTHGRAYAAWAASGMSGGLVGSLVGGFLSAAAADLLRLTQQHAEPFALTLLLVGVATMPAALLISRAADVGPQPAARAEQPAASSSEPAASSSEPVPLLAIAVMFLVMWLRVTPGAIMYTYGSVFLDQVQGATSQAIGTAWSASMALAIPLVLASAELIRRFGADRTLTVSLAAVALVMLPIALFDSRPGALVTLIGFNGLTHIARTALVLTAMSSVSARWRTTMAGATETAAALAFIAAGFGGGQVIDAWGYDPVFMAGCVGCVLAIVCYRLYRRRSSVPAQ